MQKRSFTQYASRTLALEKRPEDAALEALRVADIREMVDGRFRIELYVDYTTTVLESIEEAVNALGAPLILDILNEQLERQAYADAAKEQTEEILRAGGKPRRIGTQTRLRWRKSAM